MTFAEAVTAADVTATITPDPEATYTLQQVGSNGIALHWDNDPVIRLASGLFGNPPAQFAYRVSLSGAASGELEIAYIRGDVNCSGKTGPADKSVVEDAGNWHKDLTEVADVRADPDRSGYVDNGDQALIQTPSNYLLPLQPATCTCP